MKRKFFKAVAAATLVAGNAGAFAQTYSIITDANTITSQSFNVLTFNSFDELLTNGPINVGAEARLNITFTSDPNTRLGATNQDLGDNGLWGARDLGPTITGDGGFVAGTSARNRSQFRFSFDNPVALIGGYFNQYQTPGTTNNRLDLIAYDRAGRALQSYEFRINTSPDTYNQGSFLGIQSSAANIYGFGVSGGTVVMDNLTFTAPVPEPSTYALMGAALLLLGAAAHRRRKP